VPQLRKSVLSALVIALGAANAVAQTPAPTVPGYAQPQPGYGQPQPGYVAYPVAQPSRKRTQLELGTLYGMSAVYGVGVGTWVSVEAGVKDPAVFLIPPVILGVAGPVGVYFLDQPQMPKGMPLAIATGLLIGAGEGVGIATYQITSAPTSRDSWGFRGFARSTAIGATVGGVGGFLAGYYLEPSPRSSLLTGTGVLLGTAIGATFGYGVSPTHESSKRVNEWPALGGLIGLNVAAVGTAALSTVWVPSYEQIGWMWGGAGIGAAVSLPVFLLYIGSSAPQHGFIFMGTTTLLGAAAGAVFAPGSGAIKLGDREGSDSDPPSLVSLSYVVPLITPSGLGVQVGGVLF